MQKAGLIFKGTIIAAITLFVIELLSFLLFNDIYNANIGTALISQKPFILILKLFFVNIIVGFLIACIFDFFYLMLPGGFLRKALYFAFILFALGTITWLLHFFIIFNMNNGFFFLLLIEYMLLDFIIALILVGIYNEYYLIKQKGIKTEPNANTAAINKQEEKNVKKDINTNYNKPV